MIVTITWRKLGDRMTSLKLSESTIMMDGLSIFKRFIMSLKVIGSIQAGTFKRMENIV